MVVSCCRLCNDCYADEEQLFPGRKELRLYLVWIFILLSLPRLVCSVEKDYDCYSDSKRYSICEVNPWDPEVVNAEIRDKREDYLLQNDGKSK